MKDFPVRVDLLCRFRTQTEQTRKPLQTLKKGLVDIVIGTHRVLSKDVEFKDLGLLIIDEEQRFGVAHKEKIKTASGKCGCADADGDTDPQNPSHEPDRYPGYERAGGGAQ